MLKSFFSLITLKRPRVSPPTPATSLKTIEIRWMPTLLWIWIRDRECLGKIYGSCLVVLISLVGQFLTQVSNRDGTSSGISSIREIFFWKWVLVRKWKNRVWWMWWKPIAPELNKVRISLCCSYKFSQPWICCSEAGSEKFRNFFYCLVPFQV